MKRGLWLLLLCGGLLGFASLGGAAASSRPIVPGDVSPLVAQATDLGPAPPSLRLHVVVGLKLRHKARLDAFLADVSNPSSPRFRRFLNQKQFNARYGPTRAQERAVLGWLRSSGFRITQRFRNRLLVAAAGDARAAGRAFGVTVHRVRFHGAVRYSVLESPTSPARIASFTASISGLDNLGRFHPAGAVGSACCHFSPSDVRAFYDGGGALDGSGQTIAIVTAHGVKDADQQGFDAQWGLPAFPAGSAQICVSNGGGSCTGGPGFETTLDTEWSHATAPGAVIKWYTVNSPSFVNFTTMIGQVVADNLGHVVSMSWGTCESAFPSSLLGTMDDLLANAGAIGQTWFLASGDSGAFDCGSKSGPAVDYPGSTPRVTDVGGTEAVCSSGMTPLLPACGGYGSESAWSGSGGGASSLFSKPAWQTGCNVPGDGVRDVPDVALLGNQPRYWTFFTGKWYGGFGTSFGAPQWAGIFAQLNQKLGGNGLGLANPRLYQLCGRNALHDITTGDNGLFSAGPGYDQVTGLGTVDVRNLIKSY
jgi:subtilase family serine protease